MRFLALGGTQQQSRCWLAQGESMKYFDHVRRRGLASQLERWLKKLARKIVVRRWLFILVVKIIGWLVRRLWLDNEHSNLSP